MAEQSTKTPAAPAATKRVFIPRRAPGDDTPQYVGVNGKSYLLKPGVEIEVPAAVAEVLENAAKAEDILGRYINGTK